MNTAPLEPVRWQPRRWLYLVSLVFLVQVALIFLLAEHPSGSAHAPQVRMAINVAADPMSEEQLAQLPALDDPTLFALPSLHGFSGAAWLSYTPMEHQFADWTNSAYWLELETAPLGKTFLDFVNTNAAAPLLIADKPLPAPPNAAPRLTNEPLASRSELHIEGDLARRTLLNPLPLPSQSHSNILANTEVQLLVDSEGETLPATLLSSCGVVEADQFALKFAATARFDPLRTNELAPGSFRQLTWGKMVFRWHTVPPLPIKTSAGRP